MSFILPENYTATDTSSSLEKGFAKRHSQRISVCTLECASNG
jgi:hypothetical protein